MDIKDVEITIGSDPEFVILCGDNVENTLNILSKVIKVDNVCCECMSERFNADYQKLVGENLVYILEKMLTFKELIDIFPFLALEALFEYEKDPSKICELIQDKIKEFLTCKDINKINKNIRKDYLFERLMTIYNNTPNLLSRDMNEMYFYLEITDKKILIDKIIGFVTEGTYIFPPISKIRMIIAPKIFSMLMNRLEREIDIDRIRCRQCEASPVSYFCVSDIGCDGESIVGEIRAKESTDPISHFRNISKLIKRLNNILSKDICTNEDNISVIAGTYIEPKSTIYDVDISLGGHIHIGFTNFIYELEEESKARKILTTYLPEILTKFLSVYVGIPLLLIENINDRLHRTGTHNYGQFEVYELKPHGIEWKMPSSWLVSPEIAISSICLSYIVSYNIVNIVTNNVLDPNKIEKIDNKLNEHIEIDIVIKETINNAIDRILNSDYIFSHLHDRNISENELDNIKRLIIDKIYNVVRNEIFEMLDNYSYVTSHSFQKEMKASLYDILDVLDKISPSFIDYIVREIDVIIENRVGETIKTVVKSEIITSNSTNIQFFDLHEEIEKLFNELIYNDKNIDNIYKILSRLKDFSLDKCYEFVSRLEKYKEYREYVDIVFEMIQNNETWPTDDIMPRWKQLWT